MIPNVSVATDALRTEAGLWSTQSAALAALSPRVATLHISRIEAGIFQLLVSAYDTVTDVVRDRTAEGAQEMAVIATTLNQVANTYDAEDAAGEHRLRNLY